MVRLRRLDRGEGGEKVSRAGVVPMLLAAPVSIRGQVVKDKGEGLGEKRSRSMVLPRRSRFG